MKLRLIVLTLTALAASLRADTPGGWKFQVAPPLAGALPTATQAGTFAPPSSEPAPAPSPLLRRRAAARPAALTVITAGNIADQITPEIQNLATSLQNDPVRIFEFVYNAIEYEHYYGSKKGAHLTLLEGSGNDKDQASLLVALLRAAGQEAKYVTIANVVPYDATAPVYSGAPSTLCTGVSWLGLDPVPFPGIGVNPGDKPAGWSDDEFKKSFQLYNYFKNGGFPVSLDPSYKSCIITLRTLVRLTVGGVSVLWDPSAKQLSGKTALNFLTATGFNKTSFLGAIGGTVTANYVTGLSSGTIQSQLTTATSTLIGAIRTGRPNDSVRDILGRQENLPQYFNGFGDWYQVGGFVQNDDADEIPLSLMSSLEIKIDSNTAYAMKMPALQGKRLSVTANGNTVEVRQDDTVIHSATVTAATYTLKLTAKHPHFAADGVTPLHDADDGGKVYKKSASYALIYGFAPSKRLLQSRERILDDYIDRVRVLNPALVGADGAIDLPSLSDATLKRQITTELLNIMGINWLYQTDLTNHIAASLNAMNLSMFHRFGRMGQEGGFYIDVPLSYSNNYPRNGLNDNAPAYALTFAYLFSALEHGIIDQYNLASNGAVSTVQILHLANASTDTSKNRIYRADASNWSTVQSQIIGYTPAQKTEFQTKVAAGSTLYLPYNANNGSAGWTWNGSGYVEFNPTAFTTGMIISGGYAGGYSVVSSFINPAPVYSSYTYSPNYFDTGGISNVISRSTPAYNFTSYYGADPVDMATGAMVFNKEDLTLGQPGSRGLSFQRHYSSSRRDTDSAKLGYGWTHSYDLKAIVRTAPEAGLGETTPCEAAAMLAAATAINELVKDNTNTKAMVAAALAAKVAVDNLLNNAVALTVGKETVQFVKQPDGTYTAPASSTMSLAKSGTDYLATERFGNTYKFDTTNGGRVTEVKDFFNKALAFAYTSNGLNTITDAYGRTLTFGYTGGHISSVTDSTGRSVQFAYTGGNLTGATDPEGKTSTFIYDTEHRLTQLKDPQNRTVVVNRYDSESRVYEQDSQGDPTKTWKLAFSGLRNTETDPQGGEKIYFYDKRGRPLGVQDALGNRTRTVYDGQDHAIEQWTAKNELYQQTFDVNHNLTQAENPAGVKTLSQYDTLQRLTQITVQDTDPLTADRVSTIAYTAGNLANLPNTLTDPKGHVTHKTYYADGNLNTVTEDSLTGNRTTTYLYDVRGLPQKTTYPDTKFEEFVYSVRGDLTSQKDRRGNTTTFLYNNRRQTTQTTRPGSLITLQTYDDSGNVDTVTDPAGNVARFTYSATGKKLTETTAYGTPQAETVTHVYDTRDWQDYILDARAQKTDFGYDAAGQVISVKDPLNHETTFAYDANGQRILSRTALGNETHFTYNALGQEATMTDPASNTVVSGYNAYGEKKTLQNRRNNTFEFAYDANGNPTITKTPLNFTITKTWNDRNLVGSVQKASGQTTTYAYDDMRRVQSQTDPAGTIAFGYDDNGNPLTVTEGSAVLTRTWDALNRPATYTNARGETLGYQYYANGLLWKLTYPGSRVVTYTYYPTNRLKTVTDWAGRVTTYTWDVGGRLTGITRPNGVNRTNTYDNANRLERIFERDNTGRLQLYFKYGYDDDGRLVSRYRLPEPTPVVLPANTSTYDADNRLQLWNGQTVVHDADGNMTSGPLGATAVNYNYDARNRLTSVGTIGTGFTYYAYDAENNRVAVTAPAGVTRYLIDPHGDSLPRVLVREKPDATKTTYVYGIGLLYEVNDTTGDATYYHYDNTGNTAALTGATGAVTDRVEYTPYGQVTHRMGATDTPFLYVGQLGVQQEANGLLYMRARYYSPELMRFCNADPTGFAGGMNWFAYANGNPIGFTDPSGLWAGVDDLIATGVGALVGLAAQGAADLWHGQVSPGSHYLAAAVGGAVAGEATLYAGPAGWGLGAATAAAIGGAAGGLTTNVITQTADISAGRQESFSGTSALLSTGLGAAGGAGGSLIGSAVGAYAANGFKTTAMSVVIGEGSPFHVVYSAGGTASHAAGSEFFAMETRTMSSQAFAGYTSNAYTSFNLPVANAAAVTTSGISAWSCVTGALSAFARGWSNETGASIGGLLGGSGSAGFFNGK